MFIKNKVHGAVQSSKTSIRTITYGRKLPGVPTWWAPANRTGYSASRVLYPSHHDLWQKTVSLLVSALLQKRTLLWAASTGHRVGVLLIYGPTVEGALPSRTAESEGPQSRQPKLG